MSKSKKTVQDLKLSIARGPGFIKVLSHFSNSFNDAIANIGHHVDCPFPSRHRLGGGIDDFRLFPDFDTHGGAICSCCNARFDIFDLLIEDGHTKAKNDKNIFLLIDNYLSDNDISVVKTGGEQRRPVTIEEINAPHNTPAKIERRKNLLRTIMKGLIPFDHALAEPGRLYFRKRGFHVDPSSEWMFHPKLEYIVKGKSYGFHPAIVTILRDGDGKPITYHRIYITEGGDKADVPNPKLMLPAAVKGSISGSTARIRHCNSNTLHTGEGVELMHAVAKCVDGNVRAGISADMMKNQTLVIGRGVDTVIIWVDKDPYFPGSESKPKRGAKGQKSALALAERLTAQGFKVILMLPSVHVDSNAKKGVDWEDIIIGNDILGLSGQQERLKALVSFSDPEWGQMHIRSAALKATA